jgi:hypothetical protein
LKVKDADGLLMAFIFDCDTNPWNAEVCWAVRELLLFTLADRAKELRKETVVPVANISISSVISSNLIFSLKELITNF